MEPLNRMDRVMRSGAVIWACLLTLLVLVVAILSSTVGMTLGVWIFAVVCAVAVRADACDGTLRGPGRC